MIYPLPCLLNFLPRMQAALKDEMLTAHSQQNGIIIFLKLKKAHAALFTFNIYVTRGVQLYPLSMSTEKDRIIVIYLPGILNRVYIPIHRPLSIPIPDPIWLSCQGQLGSFCRTLSNIIVNLLL